MYTLNLMNFIKMIHIISGLSQNVAQFVIYLLHTEMLNVVIWNICWIYWMKNGISYMSKIRCEFTCNWLFCARSFSQYNLLYVSSSLFLWIYHWFKTPNDSILPNFYTFKTQFIGNLWFVQTFSKRIKNFFFFHKFYLQNKKRYEKNNNTWYILFGMCNSWKYPE